MKRVVVLGSSGSVGKQALQVVDELGFEVVGLACKSNYEVLSAQLKQYPNAKGAILEGVYHDVFCGKDAFEMLAKQVDYDVLIAAASGLTSLTTVLQALKDGKRVALANKEIAVCAGSLLKAAAKNGELIPVDSEHSAVFQCLLSGREIKDVTLTCSGGALRDVPIENLKYVKAEDALKHPNWAMGAKITIDCATMANKAFEVIEAAALFDIPFDMVKVLVHKESIVHGFITFKDGSVIAQLSAPDMKAPLRYALTYPNRRETKEDFSLIGKTLTFCEHDRKRYPLFDVILNAAKNNEWARAFLAGADEGAVELFLSGHISYEELHKIINMAAETVKVEVVDTVEKAIAAYEYGVDFARSHKGAL